MFWSSSPTAKRLSLPSSSSRVHPTRADISSYWSGPTSWYSSTRIQRNPARSRSRNSSASSGSRPSPRSSSTALRSTSRKCRAMSSVTSGLAVAVRQSTGGTGSSPSVVEVSGQGPRPTRAQRGYPGRREYAGAGARNGLLDRERMGRGGTGIAIRLAKHYRSPVLNLAEMDMRAAMDRLQRIAQARDPRQLEPEHAISGGSEHESPSGAVTSRREG